MTIKVYEIWGFHKDEIATLKIKDLSSLHLALIQYKRTYNEYNVYYKIGEDGKGEIILSEE